MLAGRSDYVLPARRVSKQAKYPHVSTDMLNRALDELDHGVKSFAVRDLLRTARSASGRAWRCSAHRGAERAIKQVGGSLESPSSAG